MKLNKQNKQKFKINNREMQGQLSNNQELPITVKVDLMTSPVANKTELNLDLLQEQYHKYKSEPYLYIIERMRQLHIKQISRISNPSKPILQFDSVPQYYTRLRRNDRQTVDKFLIEYQLSQKISMTDEQRIHALIAAYAHDNGHRGLTNSFYINSEDDLAIRYSNVSPLENMHSSNLMASLRQHGIKVSAEMKQLMVKLILATDNKHHFQLLEKVKLYQKNVKTNAVDKVISIHQGEENGHTTKLSPNHRETLLQMLIHTADLSPCGKTIPEYMKWNQKLYDEFKFEYKLERKLNLKTFSFKFDLSNEKYSFAVQNISFLNGMILPFFKEVSFVMSKFQKELSNAFEIRQYFLEKVNQMKEDKKKNLSEEKHEK